jgi:Domain of unknown function (DUF6817)
MPRPPQAALLLLEELGVSETRRHLAGRSFAEHLTATFEILADWGAPEEVTLAGLFHSVYGTEAFDHPSLPPDGLSRLRVRNTIGAAAERLVYMFCALEREMFLANPAGRRLANRFDGTALAFRAGDLAAVCEIFMANEIDLAIAKKGRDPKRVAAKAQPIVLLLLPHLPERSRQVWRRYAEL